VFAHASQAFSIAHCTVKEDLPLLSLLLPWYFIFRVLKLAKAKMYVRNGYDGDSEIVNVLARHTALKH